MKQDISKILWKSHILIIDYNTFHYTSFDIFRAMLLNREFSRKLLPEYRSFFRMKYDQQARFFFEQETERDLYHLFSLVPDDEFPYDMYDLADMYYNFDGKVSTDTDLNVYMRVALQNKTIDRVSILRHPDDNTMLRIPDECNIYRSKGLFNADLIAEFINNYRVNAVILDSIDLAMEISEKTEYVTFLFGTYGYNFDYDHENRIRMMKRIDDMNAFKVEKHHEYGRFDPIRALTVPQGGNNTDGQHEQQSDDSEQFDPWWLQESDH